MKKLVSVTSRTGREFQRYNLGGGRQVVGCIPYRHKTNNNSAYDVEVLLISSQKSPRLMFPKGGWELDESIEEAASRETFEEAGVRGIVGNTLGMWDFMSKSQGTLHEGHMLPLFVTEEFDDWPEKDSRQRKWMTIEQASKDCYHSWMKEALNEFVGQLNFPRKEEEGVAPCSSEYPKTEEPRDCIGAQNAEEDLENRDVAQNGEEEVDDGDLLKTEAENGKLSLLECTEEQKICFIAKNEEEGNLFVDQSMHLTREEEENRTVFLVGCRRTEVSKLCVVGQNEEEEGSCFAEVNATHSSSKCLRINELKIRIVAKNGGGGNRFACQPKYMPRREEDNSPPCSLEYLREDPKICIVSQNREENVSCIVS